MSNEPSYKYIAIEGNIGAGKTSLCELLAREYRAELILEEFADNPFLPYFYKDPTRYALTLELSFMTERHKQLQEVLFTPSLFSDMIISDFIFWKSIIFARKNLIEEEYRLLQNIFGILNNNFPNPDLLVYLHRSPTQLLRNIKVRGRSYEQGINSGYLMSIQDSYFDFFKSQWSYPILILEVEEVDFVHNPAHLEELKFLIFRKYLPGIHRIKLHL